MAKTIIYTCDRCGRPIEGEEPAVGPTIRIDDDTIHLPDLHPKCAATVDEYLRRALLRAHPDDARGGVEDEDSPEDEMEQRRRLPPAKKTADPEPQRPRETAEEYVRRTAQDEPPEDTGPEDLTTPGVDPDGDLAQEIETPEDAHDFDDEVAEQAEQLDEETSDDPAEPVDPGLFDDHPDDDEGHAVTDADRPAFAFAIGDQVEEAYDDGDDLFRGEVTARSYSDPVEYEVSPSDGKPRTFYADGLRKIDPATPGGDDDTGADF